MPDVVAFHFVLLAVGEVLKVYPTANAQKVQDFIQEDEAFGVRLPLETCRMALDMLEKSGFILQIKEGEYGYPSHN